VSGGTLQKPPSQIAAEAPRGVGWYQECRASALKPHHFTGHSRWCWNQRLLAALSMTADTHYVSSPAQT